MDMRRARTQALVLAGALLLLVGCSTSGSPSVSGGTGHLEIHLTDSPIDLSNVTSVDVTITDEGPMAQAVVVISAVARDP